MLTDGNDSNFRKLVDLTKVNDSRNYSIIQRILCDAQSLLSDRNIIGTFRIIETWEKRGFRKK